MKRDIIKSKTKTAILSISILGIILLYSFLSEIIFSQDVPQKAAKILSIFY